MKFKKILTGLALFSATVVATSCGEIIENSSKTNTSATASTAVVTSSSESVATSSTSKAASSTSTATPSSSATTTSEASSSSVTPSSSATTTSEASSSSVTPSSSATKTSEASSSSVTPSSSATTTSEASSSSVTPSSSATTSSEASSSSVTPSSSATTTSEASSSSATTSSSATQASATVPSSEPVQSNSSQIPAASSANTQPATSSSSSSRTSQTLTQAPVTSSTTPTQAPSLTDASSFKSSSVSDVVTSTEPSATASQSSSQSSASNPVVADSNMRIIEAAADQESLYAKFHAVEGATSYNAYVKTQGASSYTKLDTQLIRKYKDGTFRVDAVGLKAGNYELKIVPVINGSETTDTNKIGVVSDLSVVAYDRTGFAFSKTQYYDSSKEGFGAYNLDGTLKSNAVVLYVGASNAKTIKYDMIVDSKGNKETRTGLQNILQAFEKGAETRPFDIRIIGEIKKADMDSFGSSAEGLQIKGKSTSASAKNITIEGIGNDATIHGFGFLVKNTVGFEMRNLGVMTGMDDDISLDGGNYNTWVHDNDLFYGPNGSGDHAKGDGALDIKGTFYATLAYNHYFDSGKSTLHSNSSSIDVDYVSYHHNWFDHSDSRHPRVRCSQNVHIYNNYYDGNAKYGIGSANGASIFSEANYFRSCTYPFLTGYMGHDEKSDGSGYTMSGEKGGVIKSYGDYFTGKCTYTAYTSGSQNYDVYIASSRDEQISSSVYSPSGKAYSNFDTNSSVMYQYTLQTPEAAKNTATKYAGRVAGGDFKWTFDNSTEDANYSVIPGLRKAIDDYTSSVVEIQGLTNGNTTPGTTPTTPTESSITTISSQTIITTTPTSSSSSQTTNVTTGTSTIGTGSFDGWSISGAQTAGLMDGMLKSGKVMVATTNNQITNLKKVTLVVVVADKGTTPFEVFTSGDGETWTSAGEKKAPSNGNECTLEYEISVSTPVYVKVCVSCSKSSEKNCTVKSITLTKN